MVRVARSVRTNLLQAAGGNEKIATCPGLGKSFTNPGGYYEGFGVVLGFNFVTA